MTAIHPPNIKEPVSPMNIFAGAVFHHRKPAQAPAKIFMGDTGSLMLGGCMAVMAILLNTQLLLVILGGLFVVETLSVIVQVLVFRRTGRRIFLMAPIHHHFELAGWPEFTVIVRFWVLSGLSVAFGLGLFYADFLSKGGLR